MPNVKVDVESARRLLALIGDAEVMDGTPIPPEKVDGVCIHENCVALSGGVEYGTVIYYTESVWKFLEKAMRERLG